MYQAFWGLGILDQENSQANWVKLESGAGGIQDAPIAFMNQQAGFRHGPGQGKEPADQRATP